MATSRYCEERSAPFPIESCCGHTSRWSGSPGSAVDGGSGSPGWPKCNNCGEVPTIKDPPQLAESVCVRPAGHRGKHSWER